MVHFPSHLLGSEVCFLKIPPLEAAGLRLDLGGDNFPGEFENVSRGGASAQRGSTRTFPNFRTRSLRRPPWPVVDAGLYLGGGDEGPAARP